MMICVENVCFLIECKADVLFAKIATLMNIAKNANRIFKKKLRIVFNMKKKIKLLNAKIVNTNTAFITINACNALINAHNVKLHHKKLFANFASIISSLMHKANVPFTAQNVNKITVTFATRK